MLNKLVNKPFKLIALVGFVGVAFLLIANIISGFSYEKSVYPYAQIVTFISLAISLLLCLLTFIFYNHHIIYYIALELLTFQHLYCGSIYVSIFLSALLMVLFLTEKITPNIPQMAFFFALEIVKVIMVVPYGVTSFFYYLGLELFSLCTVSCINLLFAHAYNKKEDNKFNLDDFKLTDRQKDCIKEIVLNNTTIKALALNHNVSESAIKKDLAQIYKVLRISGKADLKALFIDYQF